MNNKYFVRKCFKFNIEDEQVLTILKPTLQSNHLLIVINENVFGFFNVELLTFTEIINNHNICADALEKVLLEFNLTDKEVDYFKNKKRKK